MEYIIRSKITHENGKVFFSQLKKYQLESALKVLFIDPYPSPVQLVSCKAGSLGEIENCFCFELHNVYAHDLKSLSQLKIENIKEITVEIPNKY